MRSFKDGLKLYAQIIKSGFTPAIVTCNQLIHLYAKHRFMQEARRLFDEMPHRNVFTWNTIINAYIKAQNLTQAQIFFEATPHKDVVSYNSMLSGYVNCVGYETHAVKLFVEMQSESDDARFDEVTLTTMLNLTAKLCALSYGRQLHSCMVKTGNHLSGFAISALVDMYSKCGCFGDAWRVFSWSGDEPVVDLVSKNAMVAACCREGEMEKARELFWREPELNDVVSWNTLISGCAQNGYRDEAIVLFRCMAENGFRWNEHTFTSVLNACAGHKNLKLGKEVHAWVLKEGLDSNPFVSSGIVDVYCKCDNMKYAESVHATMGRENSFSVTSMIVGYSSQGNMVEAKKLFDSLTEKNSVLWTAMFTGYVKSHLCENVFELFMEFKAKEKVVPDALIFISMLAACAMHATVNPGKQIHAYMLRVDIETDEKMLSALVDMYAKCGNITYAEKVFQRVTDRDAVLYNIMISGYAHHGYEYEAFQHFEKMMEGEIQPDAVTFIAVLSACRHCGLVELGEKYFSSMIEDFSISPEVDHYACMIDLYGRSNQLEKAVKFMEEIPMDPDAVILGTFLNACKINGNVELAREAEERLLRIEGDNGARYTQLANIYALEGRWDEMGRIMRKMRRMEIKKLAGCSWLHVGNKINIFTSGRKYHSEAGAIYFMLNCLISELNEQPTYDALIEEFD